ncbi:MAG: hypothetical protein H3C43_06660 [Leptonema sp. (in: Bacteria)]|nr:hypothetical protein [Leptonema sp. (in: bacteria)]
MSKDTPAVQKLNQRKTDLCMLSTVIVTDAAGNSNLQNQIFENFKLLFQDLDSASQGKILLFFKALVILSYLLKFKDWRNMNNDDQLSFFRKIESFSVGLIRAGFFGLRSLIFLSYYSTETSWQRIGYQGPLPNITNRSIYKLKSKQAKS